MPQTQTLSISSALPDRTRSRAIFHVSLIVGFLYRRSTPNLASHTSALVFPGALLVYFLASDIAFESGSGDGCLG